MDSRFIRSAILMAGIAAGASAAPPASAAEDGYFKDRTVTIMIGSRAGGTYDLYSRVLATRIGEYLPGKPSIIFTLRQASGGMIAANHMHNVAPRDGTVIGTTQHTIPVSQVINPNLGKFDVRQWAMVGTMTPARNLFAIWRQDAPATTIEGVKQHEVRIGATSRSSPTYIIPKLMNQFIGTKFKFVLGYKFDTLHLAMEQGEHNGVNSSLYSFEKNYPHYITQNKVAWLVQVGQTKHPKLPDVPLLRDLVENETHRQVLDLVTISNEFGHFYFLPPGVSKDVTAMWRQAFTAALADPMLLAEAKKRANMPIEPKDHAHLDRLVAQIHSASPEIVAQAREAMAAK